MISVIICSREPSLAADICRNIGESIGVEHEILVTDNSVAKKGICSAYNAAVKKARFPILCFVHEDVYFKSQGWGTKLAAHFTESDTGIIGLAGGDAMSEIPSTWSNCLETVHINILQGNSVTGQPPTPLHFTNEPPHSLLKKRVIGVDGVFMAIQKIRFAHNSFDETLLTGFHGYDIDLSLQLAMKYKNYVVFDIDIEHFSTGSLNKEWLKSTVLIAKKWETQLPVFVVEPTKKRKEEYYWQSLHVFIKNMLALKIKTITAYDYALRLSLKKNFTFRRFLSMNRHFLKEFAKIQFKRNVL